MKRADITIDTNETDIEELRDMIEKLVRLVDHAESEVNEIESLLNDISIDNPENITMAYSKAKELSSNLY